MASLSSFGEMVAKDNTGSVLVMVNPHIWRLMQAGMMLLFLNIKCLLSVVIFDFWLHLFCGACGFLFVLFFKLANFYLQMIATIHWIQVGCKVSKAMFIHINKYKYVQSKKLYLFGK